MHLKQKEILSHFECFLYKKKQNYFKDNKISTKHVECSFLEKYRH